MPLPENTETTATQSPVEKRTFTRTQILAALTLHPCHITGMHTPEHHIDHRSSYDGKLVAGYVCGDMKAKALAGLLGLIGAELSDLPHALHAPEQCGWCHRVPSQEHFRAQLRKSYEWAGVPVPVELATRESA